MASCGGGEDVGSEDDDEATGFAEFEGGRDTLFEAPPQAIPWHQENRRRRDPAEDGFRTEVLNDLAGPVFKGFLEAALHGAGEVDRFEAFLAEDFESATELRPESLEVVRDDGSIVVRRGVPGPKRYSRSELLAATRTLREALAHADEVHPHPKTVKVEERGAEEFVTRALLYMDGSSDTKAVQHNLQLVLGWKVLGDDEDARLKSLEVVRFEEVESKRPLFGDVTGHVFGGVPRFRDEILKGVPEWFRRTDFFMIGNSLPGMHGMALGDVDGDGRDDVYVTQQGGLPNRLFLHRADGRVEDATEHSGLGFVDETRSALFCDLDNDGDQDAAMGVGPATIVAYNDGEARFTEFVPLRPEGIQEAYSLTAADPDLDGDLDLYSCRYQGRDNLNPVPVPYHDANNGAPNILWRNKGDRTFEDATAELGLDENNHKFSYAAIWEDLDQDGDIDLYVANDFGRNNYYRNEEGRFRDVAEEANAVDSGSGMGVTAGDYDLDGDMDLYITNMFSSAGNRIVPQTEKYTKDPELEGAYTRFARGNTLLRNKGDGTFEDMTEVAGVGISGWSWASLFLDFNNDGYQDIYSPNGYITNSDPDDT